MKRLGLAAITALFLFFTTSCNDDTNTSTTGEDTTTTSTTTTSTANGNQMAEATLSGTKTDTTVNGTVQFTQQQDGQVKMMLDITVPTKANQSVAIHFHEHADCGDMGNHAGGHWNPTNTNHGQWGQGSFHSGDIGNINLDGQGRAQKEITSNLWSIGGDASKDILNKTIVIHSGVDDYTSQPAGNSGNRIGCGVILRRG
ncbi:MAG: superoxide dismutase family protein [Chitinophagaceae bacterium]